MMNKAAKKINIVFLSKNAVFSVPIVLWNSIWVILVDFKARKVLLSKTIIEKS